MVNVMELLPEIPVDEQHAIAGIVNQVPYESAHMFAMAYRSRRKDKTTILLLGLLGILGIAGIQRFVLGQVGMGLLYLFTWGFCLIGTIIDLINHEKLARERNVKIASEILASLYPSNVPRW